MAMAMAAQKGCAYSLRPRFVLFGDSITEQSFDRNGWGALLTNRYGRKADVVLRGYSGYNTRWALHLLAKVFPKDGEHLLSPPALVTVFFGANDAVLPEGPLAGMHVPLDEYKENLREIVRHVRSVSESTRIILISPPPIDEVAYLINMKTNYGYDGDETDRTNDRARLYAEACVEIGKEMGVAVINLWDQIQKVDGDWKRCLSDGLHLSEEGNAVVFDALLRAVSELGGGDHHQSLVEDQMPIDFPTYLDVIVNPEEVFAKWGRDCSKLVQNHEAGILVDSSGHHCAKDSGSVTHS